MLLVRKNDVLLVRKNDMLKNDIPLPGQHTCGVKDATVNWDLLES